MSHTLCVLYLFFFFLMIRRPPRSTRTTHSFPTRRSSDLRTNTGRRSAGEAGRKVPAGDHDDIRRPRRRQQQHSDRMRSEEHTSELQSLMRISYAVFCLKKKKKTN